MFTSRRICHISPSECSMQCACVVVDASLLLLGLAMRLGRAAAVLLCCVGCGCCVVWAAVAVLCGLRAV